MPNWTDNQLIVKGANTELARFATAVAGHTEQGEPVPLSFESILPTPHDLTEDGESETWRCEAWGVECDIHGDTEVHTKRGLLIYYFLTAWTGPVQVVSTLATMFPSLEIKLAYSDESMSLAGAAAFTRGKCTRFTEAYMDRDSAIDVLRRWWPDEAVMWSEGDET